MSGTIAVIGAGITGLTLARYLQKKYDVYLYEKSWRPGGRMSTRLSGKFQFDHGAQYFTIRSSAFRKFLNKAIVAGIVRPWDARFVSLERHTTIKERETEEDIYVGVPSMNSVCSYLAEDLRIKCENEVIKCHFSKGSWFLDLSNKTTVGPFCWLISTIPAHQNYEVFNREMPSFDELGRVRMAGCSTLMLGFEEPVGIDWQGALVSKSPIGWIGLDSSKPERPANTSLVVQSTGMWGDENLNTDGSEIMSQLFIELKEISGIDGWSASYRSLHRWRYAGTPKAAGQKYFLDASKKLAICGDWCIKGRVEAAFESAAALAAEIL